MDESDGQLLAATARGDAEAFGRFYRRYEPRMLSYAIAHCANASDVADVVGETFLAALGAAGRFSDDGGDAAAWLLGIARHVLAHQRRSFARRQRLLGRLQALPALSPDEADAVEAAIDACRLAPRLAAALGTLRAKDRELLQLVSGDGLSPAQAGAVLGMNPNTARVRLPRARARLRDALAGTHHGSDPIPPTRTGRCRMLSLDDRPAPPKLPQFSRDLEQFLLAAARAPASRRPATAARRRKYAAAGLATAAVVAAAAAGIDHAAGGGPHPPGAGGPAATQSGGVHIHLAAFSVDSNPGGTVTLTLTQGQIFDPSTLRQALAKAGVPALVTVGSVCTVPGPSDALPLVISRPAQQPGGSSVTIITPSAIPAGEKLSVGYFAVPGGGGVHISLVPDNAPLTCTSTPPAPPGRGGAAR